MAPLGEARGRPSAATKTQDSQIKINTFLKKPFGTFTNDWCEVFQQVKNVKVLAAQSWTITRQAPLSMEFSRQEYWVGSHSLLQGIFLTQGANPGLPHSLPDSLPAEPPGKPNFFVALFLGLTLILFIF